MEIRLPEKVEKILETFKRAGFSAYIVGGCVRDSLMGRTPKDWDITTSAQPEEIKSLFSHTVDTGIQHGTVTVVLGKENFEVTTYRIEAEYSDARHPDAVLFTDSLTEDLKRRDFTMNAVAYHPEEGFLDPFFGMDDIKRGVIRGVGNPEERFLEDALRMLRAVRFAAQLGFSLEKETYSAIQRQAALIQKISAERIREELWKLLLSDYTEKLPLLWESGLLDAIAPSVAQLVQAHSEELCTSFSVFQKSMEKRQAAIAFALLLQFAGEKDARAFLSFLKFDTRTFRDMGMLLAMRGEAVPKTPYEVRKLASRLGTRECILLLDYFSIFTKETEGAYQIFDDTIKRGYALSAKDLAVDGNRLMELGVPKGREIGQMLSWLLEAVLLDPAKNKREILENMVKEKISSP